MNAEKLTTRGAICAVKFCSNNKRNLNQNISLFRFPKDINRCKTWVKACGCEHLFRIVRDLNGSMYRVCSFHFPPEMIKKSVSKGSRLTTGAIPVLNLPGFQENVAQPSHLVYVKSCQKMDYSTAEKVFIVRQYWVTNSFKQCQEEFLKKFGGHDPPAKDTIWNLVKRLETTGSLVDSYTSGRHKLIEDACQRPTKRAKIKPNSQKISKHQSKQSRIKKAKEELRVAAMQQTHFKQEAKDSMKTTEAIENGAIWIKEETELQEETVTVEEHILGNTEPMREAAEDEPGIEAMLEMHIKQETEDNAEPTEIVENGILWIKKEREPERKMQTVEEHSILGNMEQINVKVEGQHIEAVQELRQEPEENMDTSEAAQRVMMWIKEERESEEENNS